MEADTLDSFQFERGEGSVAHGPPTSDEACKHLWREFSAIALASKGEELLLRTLAPVPTNKSNISHWLTIHPGGDRRYVTLLRTPFFAAIRASGMSTVVETLKGIRANTAGFIEVERPNYPLMLWLASALGKQPMGFRFLYDTIQHSANVIADLNQTHGAFEKVRTVFLSGAGATAKVSWNDRFWSPVSSGFVIAGQKD